MSKYVDLVICECADGGNVLCLAPAWSHLDGKEVIIKKGDEEIWLTAIASKTVDQESDDYNFYLLLAGTGLEIPKIVKRVEYYDLDWREDTK